MRNADYDWAEFLKLAQLLKNHISTESAYRTAISRAYYAAYWKARLLLEANGAPMPGRNEHHFVWECYRNSKKGQGRSIQMAGHQLKMWRVDADYVASILIEKRDADKAVVYAERLLNDITEISGKDKQTALSNANRLIADPMYSRQDG